MKKVFNIRNIFNILFLLLFILSIIIFKYSYKYNSIIAIDRQNTATYAIKSQLAEKLVIIANSKVFIQFIRSGEISRKDLLPYFNYEIAKYNDNNITGFNIKKNNNLLITYGETADLYITLELCYLDDNLNLKFGVCEYQWQIYLDPNRLIENLDKLNKDIFLSLLGKDIFASKELGNFHIKNHTPYFIKIKINNKFNTGFILVIFSAIFMLIYFIYNHINLQQQKKSEIIAEIAHDLKNPLASIKLLKKYANFKNLEIKNLFESSIESLNNISHNILYKYKDNNMKILEPENITIDINNIINNNKIIIKNNNIKLILKIDKQPIYCKMDSLVLNRAIDNFIKNSIEAIEAINHKNGKIKISLFKSNNYAVLKILDNGCGIAKNNLEKIFYNKISTKKTGNGLGLYSAQKNLKKFGVKIYINSRENIATCISVKIPVML